MHAHEVGQLEPKHDDAVVSVVVLQLSEPRYRALHVPGADDGMVGGLFPGLLKELLDDFETLHGAKQTPHQICQPIPLAGRYR